MSQIKINGKNVLITGASFGFGHEFAKHFAADGYNLILVARSADRLNTLAQELSTKYGIQTWVMTKNLFDRDAPNQLYAELKEKNIPVHILVNNAGFGTYGQFSEIELEQDLNLVQLNVVVVTHMTKLFMRDMLARNEGRILNVASMAAFLPGPYMATYFASKAYVYSLTDALAEELRGTNVSIMALCPGVAATNFQQTASNEKALIGGKIDAFVMSASSVVDTAYSDFMQGKKLSIPGVTNKLMHALLRFIPRSWMNRAVRLFNQSDDIKVYRA